MPRCSLSLDDTRLGARCRAPGARDRFDGHNVQLPHSLLVDTLLQFLCCNSCPQADEFSLELGRCRRRERRGLPGGRDRHGLGG
eukprot:9855211-Lingulodinium_polyedra.AAC.1